MLSKYFKMHLQETLATGLNVLEFFCVTLYTDYLSNLHKNFQTSSACNTNIECQIWSFCYNLFLSYAVNTLLKSVHS